MGYHINKREKVAIIAAVVILGAFIVSSFIISPFIKNRKTLIRSIAAEELKFRKILIEKAIYESQNKQAAIAESGIKNRDPEFRLFSYLDRLAGETGLKDHTAYMKPSESLSVDKRYKIIRVETKLQGITMEMLVKYIYKIETPKNMTTLKKLSIKKTGKQKELIDAVLLAETFENNTRPTK